MLWSNWTPKQGCTATINKIVVGRCLPASMQEASGACDSTYTRHVRHEELLPPSEKDTENQRGDWKPPASARSQKARRRETLTPDIQGETHRKRITVVLRTPS